ncbi:TetR/AcrR family transcriptional regulator [Haliangium ochraceum]|uniref:Transcriptional regulator, TetR family n=1 Tax=Haliangium ochraceum (strain DSM 14365 / JCM 11303 / SMP-2) TaxID=502025 RepID=D0LXT4_HALO1|nr:TetR/AcrR family transcriptional regulator [Haliangium ochraceum]ACY14289.1 transcriptional regulator, TetR family [Haliangium ochraceum DSM 14365]
MKSPIDSRARFLETTAALLRRQGYHATGLSQIVKRSGAPKGSLYFHFPGGKEELAAAALAQAGEEMYQNLRALALGAAEPGGAIRAVTTALADELEQSQFLDGCPLATVALEASVQSPALQRICSQTFTRWQALIVEVLTAADIEPETAAAQANLVLCAIEGALLISRAHLDVAPLRAAGEQLAALFD